MKVFVSALLLSYCVVAAAQLRAIPADAKLGQMTHIADMQIQLDGQPAQLSAGAQIRNVSNMIVLPVALPKDSIVKYQLDAEGRVHRAWILTPREAQIAKEKGQ